MRMTGLRLSWRIEYPTLYLNATSLDCIIETPNDFTQNQVYNATLYIPKDFVSQTGNETLVVELEWDTIQNVTYVTGGGLHRQIKDKGSYLIAPKTWDDADSVRRRSLTFNSFI